MVLGSPITFPLHNCRLYEGAPIAAVTEAETPARTFERTPEMNS